MSESDRCRLCPNRDRGVCNSPIIMPDRKYKYAFVGSHPTADEVKKGGYFTGESGILIKEILNRLGVDLDECFFTYAVKCTQAFGKEPDVSKKAGKELLAACRGKLMADLIKAKPDYIVTMGAFATAAILGKGRAITKRRGLMETWNLAGIKDCVVMPTINARTLHAVPEYYNDVVNDLWNLIQVANGREIHVQPPYERYQFIRTESQFDKFLEILKGLEPGTPVAMDLETSGLNRFTDRILCYGFSWKPRMAVILDWESLMEGNPENISRLNKAVAHLHGVFHNGSFDAAWIWHVGVKNLNFYADTMLMHYLIDERKGTHGLERLAIDRYAAPPYEYELKQKFKLPGSGAEEENVSYDVVDREDLYNYNGADVDYTIRLFNDLSKELEEDGQTKVLHTILMPAVKHFMRLEDEGMMVDLDYLAQYGSELETKLAELDQGLIDQLKLHGAEGINLNSRQQLSKFMFETLKLQQMPSENPEEFIPLEVILELTQQVEDEEAQDYFKTASSATFSKLKSDSTAAYMLWWLAQQHEFPRLLVKRRDVSTYHKNYIKGTKIRLEQSGANPGEQPHLRIRPKYRLHGTVTGRLSSTDPNIHGMPRKPEVKDIYMADPGWTLIAADYSQAEVRMLGHFSNDQKLIDALNSGDIHANVAANLFHMSIDEFNKLDKDTIKFRRRAAKTIVFGRIYGRGAKSMAPQIGVSHEEAKKYSDAFDATMPDARRWIEAQKTRVIREQEAVSIYGRKRRFPLITSVNKAEAERQGVNMPIQSSVSDMTLLANMRIIADLESRGIPCKVWPHIHDGFLFQVPLEHELEALETTKRIMHDPGFETKVHFACEIEVGPKWGQMKKWFEG